MNKSLNSLLFLSILSVVNCIPCMNGASYSKRYHKCYYFFTTSQTYRGAEHTCSSINARLVTFQNRNEQLFVHRQYLLI